MATCTVLLYDHLLALEDEVRAPQASRDFLLTSHPFFEDRIRLVWKGIAECAHFLERFLRPHPCAAFWLFIFVSFVFFFRVRLVSIALERVLPHQIPVLADHR